MVRNYLAPLNVEFSFVHRVYSIFASVVVIVAWSVTLGNVPAASGPSGTLYHLGNVTAEVLAYPAVLEGYSSAPDAGQSLSLFINLPVVFVAVTGLCHIGFTCKHFSRLGYPPTRQETECQAYTRKRCRRRSQEGRSGHERNVRTTHQSHNTLIDFGATRLHQHL